MLLNWVPAVNAFGKEISMLPIMIIMFVTSVKDLFEDRKRYLSDKKVNNNSCRIYNHREEKWESRCWKELRAGDLVHLSNDEMIPADILLLHTSDTNGYCYIDTLNLDGETNLKQREVPRGLQISQDGRLNPKELLADLECDAPTTKIYRFHGSLVQPWGERIVVGKDNLLLRECIVKNTDFVEHYTFTWLKRATNEDEDKNHDTQSITPSRQHPQKRTTKETSSHTTRQPYRQTNAHTANQTNQD